MKTTSKKPDNFQDSLKRTGKLLLDVFVGVEEIPDENDIKATEEIVKTAFASQVLNDFLLTIGRSNSKKWGILACTDDDTFIDGWYYNRLNSNTDYTDIKSVDIINSVLAKWQKKGKKAVGIVISHMENDVRPTYDEIVFSNYFFKAFGNESFYLPIIISDPENGFYKLYLYVINRENDDRLIVSLDYILKSNRGYKIVVGEPYSQTYSISELDNSFEKTDL